MMFAVSLHPLPWIGKRLHLRRTHYRITTDVCICCHEAAGLLRCLYLAACGSRWSRCGAEIGDIRCVAARTGSSVHGRYTRGEIQGQGDEFDMHIDVTLCPVSVFCCSCKFSMLMTACGIYCRPSSTRSCCVSETRLLLLSCHCSTVPEVIIWNRRWRRWWHAALRCFGLPSAFPSGAGSSEWQQTPTHWSLEAGNGDLSCQGQCRLGTGVLCVETMQ